MLGSLVLLLAATALPPRQDVPVQISLNSDGRYQFGDRARLHVRSAEDGYLVVLRTDVNGWVRVVYPLSPGDNNYIHRGQDLDIRGSEGGDAFAAGLTEGVGTIVAARAHDSFHFDRYATDGHWNYRVIDSLRAGQDNAENTLVGIVQEMAGDVPFQYDVAQYSVSDPDAIGRYADAGAYPSYPYGAYPAPYWYYDPFYYAWNPWYYGPFFNAYCFGCFPRFGFGVLVTFARPYRPFFPGRVGRPFSPYRPRGFETGFRVRAPMYRAPSPRAGEGGRRFEAMPGRAPAGAAGGRRVSESRAYAPRYRAPSYGTPGYGGRAMGGYGGARAMSGGGRASGGGYAARGSGGGRSGGGGGGGGRRR